MALRVKVTLRYSLRVGLAMSLASACASVDIQVADRWKSSQMLAHYAKVELQNAVQLQGPRTEKCNSLLEMSSNAR